ncbi:MAG: alpha-ribazole phosphatase [Anaerolineae bacterium]|nr:alpha-ribazole phosphatase [Anaerolineae bacterium]
MLRLLLTRHGLTEWNVEQRHQGDTDVPLNDTGRNQAKALARRLAQEKVDIIYTSDLSRARETAQEVARLKPVPLYADKRLRELAFGEWQGLTHDQIVQRDPELWQAWLNDRMNNCAPGGETLAEFAERTRSLLTELIAKHQDQTALLVAHGGNVSVMLCLLLNLSPQSYWQFRVRNTSLSELLLYDKGAIIQYLNDTHHLRLEQPACH